jgi:hypothetical protein
MVPFPGTCPQRALRASGGIPGYSQPRLTALVDSRSCFSPMPSTWSFDTLFFKPTIKMCFYQHHYRLFRNSSKI